MLNQQRKFSLVLNCSNLFTHRIKKYHRLSARSIHPSFLDSCVVLGILSVPLDPHGSVLTSGTGPALVQQYPVRPQPLSLLPSMGEHTISITPAQVVIFSDLKESDQFI